MRDYRAPPPYKYRIVGGGEAGEDGGPAVEEDAGRAPEGDAKAAEPGAHVGVAAGDPADDVGLGEQLFGDGDGGGHASPGVTGTLPATWTPGTIPPRIIAIPAQSGAHS